MVWIACSNLTIFHNLWFSELLGIRRENAQVPDQFLWKGSFISTQVKKLLLLIRGSLIYQTFGKRSQPFPFLLSPRSLNSFDLKAEKMLFPGSLFLPWLFPKP